MKSTALLAIISTLTITALLLSGCTRQIAPAISNAPVTATEQPGTSQPEAIIPVSWPTPEATIEVIIPKSVRLDVPHVFAGLKDIQQGNQ